MQKEALITLLLIRMFTNFGRDVVFSADLCYNGANEKASPFGRGGGEADGEGKMEREPLKKIMSC